jgi:hypothetical protein
MCENSKPNHQPPNSSADSAATPADLEHTLKRTCETCRYFAGGKCIEAPEHANDAYPSDTCFGWEASERWSQLQKGAI